MTSIHRNGEVEFRFFRREADQVAVAGDFTCWQAQARQMSPEGNGWWSLRLNLAPGEYRFRYYADGVWYTDYAAYGIEFRKNIWNSILYVPKAAQERVEKRPMRLAA